MCKLICGYVQIKFWSCAHNCVVLCPVVCGYVSTGGTAQIGYVGSMGVGFQAAARRCPNGGSHGLNWFLEGLWGAAQTGNPWILDFRQGLRLTVILDRVGPQSFGFDCDAQPRDAIAWRQGLRLGLQGTAQKGVRCGHRRGHCCGYRCVV